MRHLLGAGLALGLLLSTAGPARAQSDRVGLGVAPHGGTLGFGVDVAYALHDRVNVRVGGNILPIEPEFTISDIDWKLAFQSPQFHAAVDVFLVGQLRLSGGVRYASDSITAAGVFTGEVTVGDSTYTGSDVGNLTGAIASNTLSPWVGIGWGNVARSRIGFFLDLGVAFTGSPRVSLSADGPVSDNPRFQTSLETETREFEDDISEVKYYPVVQLGFSIGF